MNNFMISAKRLITNKNTVTIIGVLIILIILYWGYKSTIDGAVKPVKVPVSNRIIGPQEEIKAEDIEWKNIASAAKPNDVLLKSGDIVGKYTGVNVTIPKGSMFYSDVLINKSQLPGSWRSKVKTDANGIPEIPYYFSVNVVTTFGNSIQPDDYIDVYMKAKDENNLIMFGKLIDNIQVLAVKDSAGDDVFNSIESDKSPAFLYFGVPSELHILLRKAAAMSDRGVELVYVPHAGANPLTGDVEVSGAYLRDYIDANSVNIPTNDEYIDDLDKELNQGGTTNPQPNQG